MSETTRAVLRMCGLALIVLAVWALCLWGNTPRLTPDATSGNPARFSANRADAVLARVLGPERPHPVGSVENAAVRARILNELATLHVPSHTFTAFSCNAWHGFSFVACATVTDIVADVVPGEGKAIVMMAHYDSVPAGPGASDDQSGVATILETIRALKAAHVAGSHPVMALFTDGEEAGLLGAKAFLANPRLKARVGAVVNVEARGSSGQSLLFQTSAGDAALIDLYATHVPVTATSSLYSEIYKYLPNDTDLTPFLREGVAALNFAFVGDIRYYHSPRDRRANLSRATLQMHGDNLLGVVRGLQHSDFMKLKSGNAVYVSVLGLWLPRPPVSWALPLSIITLLAIAFASWKTRDADVRRRGMLFAGLMPLALLVGCVALGFGLAFVAQTISGYSDPTYAYPLAMRIALAVGVWGMTLAVSRMAGVHGAATAAWLWMAALAVVSAVFLPGLSPFFLFPALVAAVLLLLTASLRAGWRGTAGQGALLVSALAALTIWFGLLTSGESLMGLKLHPLFTLPAAFGLMTLVPLLSAHPLPGRVWSRTSAGLLIAAVVGALIAGLLPAYSTAWPQRLNLVYYQNGKQPARWIADTAWKGSGTEPPPASLSRAGHFRFESEAYSGLSFGSAYVADAGAQRFPLPEATVSREKQEGGRRIVSLALRGSAQTDAMMVRIPREAQLKALRIRGENVAAPKGWSGDTSLSCTGRDCRDLAITLTSASREAFAIFFAERRYGLPDFARPMAAARPATAMPSQSGDSVLLANTVNIRPH
ncbi:MAG: M20/M25/M40 family metallo-hydrolase [Alphaproteobacteria bacterium]|nr:M20/M25/M40 family metallo-hydrolase [Alphaproteobacteria bacterium]